MSFAASLIPELEEIVQHGSPEKRTETLKRITHLFLADAPRFNDDHVQLFDDVFGRLITEIETKARAELSRRLAPVGNAPVELMQTLAKDDDIAVAGPVLMKSPRLGEPQLLEIAKTKGQAHLYAISGRSKLEASITDVLVVRGNQDVVRNVAENQSAKISDSSFSKLVRRAEKDDVLAEKVGLRRDIPAHQFRELLLRATEVVQKRLLASAKPETRAEIQRVLAEVSDEVGVTMNIHRNYSAALRAVTAMNIAGRLRESDLVDFAAAGQYEEAVAALATLASVPIEVVDRLMDDERPDPILILGKAAGFGWATVRAIIDARPSAKGKTTAGLDAARANFDRLSPSTAQRVVRFWQVSEDSREAG
ncbi:MAG: DUF2336 domain-containing protein [Rhizobiales bacterium]|nr:DUF2336 domain-containing protein [Hyphomicrobiales bacterium]